jgi:UDP-sugar transporter A1/2/3
VSKSSAVSKKKMAATIKTVVLASVTLQNSLYTLLRRYSQGVLKEPVSSAEVLIVGELMKLIASAWVTTRDTEATDAQGVGAGKLLWLASNSMKMFVLALIYGAMNVLSFVALKRIDAAAFTVCAQLKILTTAFFSVLILKRHLTWTKWRALLLVVVASILVSTPSMTPHLPSCEGEASHVSIGGGGGSPRPIASDPKSKLEESVDDLTSSYETLVGFVAVLAEVTLSGFASIYFEKVIKATNVKLTIWDRNFQLALWSIFLYAG